MKKPYLIQRMIFRDVTKNKSLSFDDLLCMDYMGSAEFEFGTLPKSLKFICKNIDNYVIYKEPKLYNYKGHNLFLLIPPELIMIIEYINSLGNALIYKKSFIKEPAYFEYHLTGKDMFGKHLKQESMFLRTEAWWDIENNVIFTFGEDKIYKIKSAILVTKEEKKNEKVDGWY